MSALAHALKARAVAEGFALTGIATAGPADHWDRFADWLARGYAGTMDYLHEHAVARQHPANVLADVRSILMVALEYGADPPPGPARIARYALSTDYHRKIWDRLNRLTAWLEAEVPGCRAHGVTDSAPLLERDLARRAGLGWIGKNCMLIHPQRGSFFFLGALLTTLDLPADPPFTAQHCGTCTACLDACPTQAFTAPGWLDARRCISYLTIELRQAIPLEHRSAVGDWLFGCDVCQEVCPWNRFATPQAPTLPWRIDLLAVDPVELLSLDTKAFRKRFRYTSLWRTHRGGLLRNAAIVLGNQRASHAIPALQQALTDADELVREAAAWALAQMPATCP
jgi:epoxyqueuosine reductase